MKDQLNTVALATLEQRVSRNGVTRLSGTMGQLRLTAVCVAGEPGPGAAWVLYLDRHPKPISADRDRRECPESTKE